MAKFDRFLISPFMTGLQTDERPWRVMDDAFTQLQNAYVFRGRVRKRFGSELMGISPLLSRLRISLGTNANISINLPANVQLAIGQMFSLGTDTYYINQVGAGVLTLSTNAGVTATIDSTSSPNTVIFSGGALSTVWFYPSLPVMGIAQYEKGPINNHPSYAFDTQFGYLFSPGAGWSQTGDSTHGNMFFNNPTVNTNYFWTCNWQGSITSAASAPVMIISNFNFTLSGTVPAATDDPMWVTPDGANWFPLNADSAMFGTGAPLSSAFYFLPAKGAPYVGPYVFTARIIVVFKNRLLLLNTVENDNSTGSGVGNATQYVNRCRYSFNGSPFAVNAWYEPSQFDSSGNTAAGAGYTDAPTEEAIVSAEFIKDRLIVYFERSTWELAYTSNEVLPFVWQKLNTELGSQSTFSTVPFDKDVLTIGNTGVHACNGSNVARIDNKIPQLIFDIFSTQASSVVRIQGIRDFDFEMVYWIFMTDTAAASNSTQSFANQVFVYNYKTGSWALNDDCFTAFGYLEQQSDVTWASSVPFTWETISGTWVSGVNEASQRQILGGTPEGFVLIIDPDSARNAASMQITDMSLTAGFLTLTVINHNFPISVMENPDSGCYILFENVVADADTMAYLNNKIFQIYSVTQNTIVISGVALASITYYGGGTLARVSNIQIYSKEFNPYDKEARNVYIQRADFIVDRTINGEITVDYYPSSTEISMIAGGTASGAIMGNNILSTAPYDAIYYPLEQSQERLIHPIYFQSDGLCIQLIMYMSAAQMTNTAIALSDFEMEGIILWTQPTVSRMQ